MLKQCLKYIAKKSENTLYFGMILNIILVIYDYRDSTLIETSHFKDDSLSNDSFWENFELIQKCISENTNYELKKQSDDVYFPRFLIYKNSKFEDSYVETMLSDDKSIGDLLGFEFKDHNYNNKNINRVRFIMIEKKTNTEFYAEIAEESKITDINIQNLLIKENNFNKCLNLFGYNVELEEHKMYTDLYIIEKISSDTVFFNDNKDLYISFLENNYISDISLLEKSRTYKEIIKTDTNLAAISKLFYFIYYNYSNINYCYKDSSDFEKIKKTSIEINKWDTLFWTRYDSNNSYEPFFSPIICKKDFKKILIKFIFDENKINLIRYLDVDTRIIIKVITTYCIENNILENKTRMILKELKNTKQNFYKILIDEKNDNRIDYSNYINITNDIRMLTNYSYIDIPYNSCEIIIINMNENLNLLSNIIFFIRLLTINGYIKIFITQEDVVYSRIINILENERNVKFRYRYVDTYIKIIKIK